MTKFQCFVKNLAILILYFRLIAKNTVFHFSYPSSNKECYIVCLIFIHSYSIHIIPWSLKVSLINILNLEVFSLTLLTFKVTFMS